MMQDWTWRCGGCGQNIEPYDIHDVERCYQARGKKMPEDSSHPLEALAVFILVPFFIWLFAR